LIYNYEENQKISVSLSLNNPRERFLTLYPVPKDFKKNTVTWNMVFKENEKLQFSENSKFYPYLFWESCNRNDEVALKDFICVKNEDVEEKLDVILENKGLNFKERCDMITYWLAELKSSNFMKIGFMDEKFYEESFPLEIIPTPKNILRVFMVFQNCDLEEKSTVNSFQKNHCFNRNGPTLIEWGGMKI